MWQISYPPANGASLGSYLSKNGFFGRKQAKWGQSKQLWYPNLQTFFDEVMIFELVGDVVKTKTDRQTNSLTPYTGVCGFFLQVKFATSLLTSLAGGWPRQVIELSTGSACQGERLQFWDPADGCRSSKFKAKVKIILVSGFKIKKVSE